MLRWRNSEKLHPFGPQVTNPSVVINMDQPPSNQQRCTAPAFSKTTAWCQSLKTPKQRSWERLELSSTWEISSVLAKDPVTQPFKKTAISH